MYKLFQYKKTFAGFLTTALIAGLFACKYDTKELQPKPKASFTVTPVSGAVNKYVLTSTSQGAFRQQWDAANGKGFMDGGTTDTVYFSDKGTYTVKLLAFGQGGFDTASQVINVAADDPANYSPFKLLTTRKWKLNPDPAANAIVVGTEGNPAQYYGGGALANCQTDDEYTFTTDFKLSYNAKGSTFYGSNIAPNYSCGADLSYNVTYTFSNSVASGLAGIATITTPGTPPSNFIGVTDISSNNYRIISISPTAMILRSGLGNETTHTFKFVAQ